MDKSAMARLQEFTTRYFEQHPVAEIKRLNRLTPEVETTLASLAPLVERHIDAVITKFYGFVTSQPRARDKFRDQAQIQSLQAINRRSFVKAFTPPFDQGYFAYRLKVGYVHYTIDLSPDLYVGAIGVLESALADVWQAELRDQAAAAAREATSRVLKVELQLTLDTYFTLGRQDVEAARRRSQEVLDNLSEGFMTVLPGATVAVASKSCARLFGAEIEGAKVAALPGLAADKAAFLASGIDQVFENFMPLEVNLSLLPARVQGEHGKILDFRYTPLLDPSGAPVKLVATVQDVTEVVAQAERQEREAQLNRALMNILRQKEAFLGFLADTDKDLAELAVCRDEALGKRLLHTLKGNSAAFGLSTFADLVHRLETQVEEELAGQSRQAFFGAAAIQLNAWLDEFFRNEGAVLEVHRGQDGESGRDQATHRLTAEDFAALQDLSAGLDGQARQRLERVLRHVQLRPATSFLSTFPNVVERLAAKLGKDVTFVVEGGALRVDPKLLGPVFKQLVHALRNALDHGVETPDERVDAGKPATATLKVAVVADTDAVSVTLSDDGRGIDTARLGAKAVEKGLVTAAWLRTAAPADILALVFADGVSTAEKVTDTSGRGVGMSALKAEVEALGGTIEIRSTTGRGTEIEVRMAPTAALTDPGKDHLRSA